MVSGRIKLLFSVLILGVLAAILVRPISHIGKAELTLTVSPAAANVSIDGAKASERKLYLPTGKHTIKVEMGGFTTQSKTVDLRNNAELVFALSADSKDATGYLKNHPADQLIQEQQGGRAFTKANEDISNFDGIISNLPHDGISFYVSYGDPIYSKSDTKYRIALYVRSKTPTARAAALAWIRSQNVDPTDVEIIFQGVENPFQTGSE